MTTNYPDADQLLMGGKGAPIAKFLAVGDEVKGTVVDKASVQQRDFTTGELKTYSDGNPQMQVVITLQTEQRDPAIDGDDGKRRVFAKGQMVVAVRDAVKEAKMDRLELGTQLAIRYIGDGEPSKKGLHAPKQYRAFVKAGKPPVDLSSDESPF